MPKEHGDDRYGNRVAQPQGFWRSAAILFVLGLCGVVSLYPTLDPVVDTILAGERPPPVGPQALKMMLLINPLILLAVGVLLGTAAARRIGTQSYIVSVGSLRARGRGLVGDMPIAIVAGLMTSAFVILLDQLTRPMLGDAGAALSSLEAAEPRSGWVTLSGVLYGGITEELMLRWGLMSALVWLLWRLADSRSARPSSWVVWSGIFASSALFGAGHLGVVDAQLGLSAPLIARTILLNGIAGAVFGWLYWKRSLEAAMMAHGAGHVGFALAALVQ